jgi:hypothetical protein
MKKQYKASDFKKLLGKNASWNVNKNFAKKLGLETALLLTHFIDLSEVVFNGLDRFYQQIDRIKEELCLSEYSIKNSLSTLKKLGIIDVIKVGMPAKNYYKLNHDAIVDLLQNDDNSLVDTKSTDLLDEDIVDSNSTLSEVTDIQHVGINSSHEEKKQEEDKQDIKKTTDQYRLKHSKILEGLIQYEDKSLFERSYESLSEITFDKIAEDNNWDTDQYNNWVDKIESNRLLFLQFS